MSKKEKNAYFVCANCESNVLPLKNGSYRNHCPFCLASIHVDNVPGDRNNSCRGVMDSIKILYHKKKGWQIIHKCQKCGIEKVNKIAEGDVQPDNWQLIVQLSRES